MYLFLYVYCSVLCVSVVLDIVCGLGSRGWNRWLKLEPADYPCTPSHWASTIALLFPLKNKGTCLKKEAVTPLIMSSTVPTLPPTPDLLSISCPCFRSLLPVCCCLSHMCRTVGLFVGVYGFPNVALEFQWCQNPGQSTQTIALFLASRHESVEGNHWLADSALCWLSRSIQETSYQCWVWVLCMPNHFMSIFVAARHVLWTFWLTFSQFNNKHSAPCLAYNGPPPLSSYHRSSWLAEIWKWISWLNGLGLDLGQGYLVNQHEWKKQQVGCLISSCRLGRGEVFWEFPWHGSYRGVQVK